MFGGEKDNGEKTSSEILKADRRRAKLPKDGRLKYFVPRPALIVQFYT